MCGLLESINLRVVFINVKLKNVNFLRNGSLQSKTDENLALGVVSLRVDGVGDLCRMPMDTFDLEHVKFIFESFSPLL